MPIWHGTYFRGQLLHWQRFHMPLIFILVVIFFILVVIFSSWLSLFSFWLTSFSSWLPSFSSWSPWSTCPSWSSGARWGYSCVPPCRRSWRSPGHGLTSWRSTEIKYQHQLQPYHQQQQKHQHQHPPKQSTSTTSQPQPQHCFHQDLFRRCSISPEL